ncbi:hypothetical protein Gohar_010596 [Gossypium harknessii]|uniref:Uncharacterized protein n=1 Tax=Gossypium harknessii TaxID=34285 RepID=A0A7J9GST6_9ROSI|nr:hypothetical protein [Gossypium harknessii]
MGEGGEELRREKIKSVNETGADFGGSGMRGRRLWNVIVLEQKPESPRIIHLFCVDDCLGEATVMEADTLKQILQQYARYLMVQDQMASNVDLIDSVFSPDEANIIKRNNEQINFHEWLSWMFENHSVNKRTEIAVVLKAIRYARNKLLHEGTNQRVENLVAFVRGYYTEIKALAESIYRRLTLQLPTAFAGEALAAVNRLRFALEIARLGNQAAHAMAQDGMIRMEDCFWVEEAPVLVTTAVDEERRLLDQP